MKIINCCNHNVEICDKDGNIVKVYEPSGHWARVRQDVSIIDYIDGIPVKVRNNNRIVGLPEPEEGTFYIVSDILRDACPERKDLLSCGGKYYERNGRIRGWTAFVCNE